MTNTLPPPRAWMGPEGQLMEASIYEAWTKYHPGKAAEYVPLFGRQDVDAAVAAERSWRDTVDDMLTVCHAVASDDPRESINRLINWHVSVALDPSVSSDAAALVAAERKRLAADAASFGNALNAAGWTFCDAYQKHTGQVAPTILFNHSKAILRDAFAVYFAAMATTAPAPQETPQ